MNWCKSTTLPNSGKCSCFFFNVMNFFGEGKLAFNKEFVIFCIAQATAMVFQVTAASLLVSELGALYLSVGGMLM